MQNRTADLRIANATLYQLSYDPTRDDAADPRREGGHDAVPPPNRKPFSIPAQIGLQPEPAARHSTAARMPDPNPKTSPLPRLLALGFALLFIAAVPWYWADGGEQPLVLGMPLWVAVSTGVSFLISCLVAWAAFHTWPSDDDDAEGGS